MNIMAYRIISAAILFVTGAILLQTTVYANSSWHWLTMSPFAIFPVAVILTLAVETYILCRWNKITNSKKAFVAVAFANLLSFAAPYLERAYRFIPTSGGFSIMAAFNKGPYYMVLTGYLLLTLLVEVPVVFLLLKNNTDKKGRLLVSILAANVLTTALVAVLERILCMGQW